MASGPVAAVEPGAERGGLLKALGRVSGCWGPPTEHPRENWERPQGLDRNWRLLSII